MSADVSARESRQGEYDIEVHRDVRIPTNDLSVTLSADVYLPVEANPVPALVTVIPYRKDFIGGLHYDGPMRWFAKRGYGCLLVDLRGTGASDGIARPRLDPGEGDDAVAAIDWASSQSWCTGNVGMWGVSYASAMTMRAASRRPPQLKATIPVVGKPDPERYDGARGDFGLLTGWGAQMLTLQLLPPMLGHTSVDSQRRWERRLYDAEPVILDLARHGRGDPEWRDRVIDIGSITVPSLCVGGWQDAFPDSVVRLYNEVKGPKKLLMGPWMHSMPQESPFEPIDFLSIALRWWDHWLLGVDSGLMNEPPVIAYTLGDRPEWRAYESWPPVKEEIGWATQASLKLMSDTSARSEQQHAIAEYLPDPTIGAQAGLGGESVGVGLPLDQHDDDTRALSVTTEPLSDDVVIGGAPEVSVRLAEDSLPAQRIVVRLSSVGPSGRSILITSGRLCPDTGSSHSVVLRPTMYRVPAGHRLRVALSDSDFPRLTPLPNPTPFRVSQIQLLVPTQPGDTGTEIDMPTIDRTEPESREQWSITRDLVRDGIEVTTGHSSVGTTTNAYRFERHSRARAHVLKDASDAAFSTGENETTVLLSSGEAATVITRVRCTQTTLWVQGDVTIDGLKIYSRSWNAPLGLEGVGP